MIATTIEQSRHLLSLGLDPATADMSWYRATVMYPYELHTLYKGHGTMDGDDLLPAWSLSALLEVIKQARKDCPYSVFSLKYYGGEEWDADISLDTEGYLSLEDTPLEAAHEMVVRLLENGHIKKGGEQ